MKNITGILAVLMILTIGLACSSDETAKANETIAEANKFITTANENVEKAAKKYEEYNKKVADIESDEDLNKARDFGKELFPLYDGMSENFKKASEKFDEASKLKVDPKYKEYLETKAKEMKMRSDFALQLKNIPQALIDSKQKKDYEENRDKIRETVNKMTKEATDLGDKAEKIRKDNPNIIKQN